MFNDIFKQSEKVELRTLQKQNDDLVLGERVLAEAHQVLEAAKQLGETYGHNVFFGVLPRDDVGQVVPVVRVVWVDLDLPTPPDENDWISLAASNCLPPSWIVSTGGGYHFYWLIEEETPEYLNKFKKVAINAFGYVDKTTFDAERILRVPGTLNWKYDPPREVKLVWSNPQIVYKPNDLLNAPNVPGATLRRLWTGDGRGFKSRSERDWKVVSDLLKVGVHVETVRSIMSCAQLRISAKVLESEHGHRYLEHTIAKAVERVEELTKGRLASEAFGEGDFCWFNTKGHQISTFVFKAQTLLHDENTDTDVLLGKIYTDQSPEGESWQLPRKAFTKNDALLKCLPRVWWQWLGRDVEVRQLLPFILDQAGDALQTGVATFVTGRKETDQGPVYVGTKGVIASWTPELFTSYDVHEKAIPVYVSSQREHLDVVFSELTRDKLEKAFIQVITLWGQSNEPVIAWGGLAWTLAAMLKPLLRSMGYSFPHLNVWGQRGGGKTTFAHGLLRWACVPEPVSYDSAATPFVMLAVLGSTLSVPISFMEFRVSHNLQTLLRYLLQAYDSGKTARGRPDQTTVEYVLTAPIIVDGEDVFSDSALMERTVFLTLSPSTVAPGNVAHQAMTKLRQQTSLWNDAGTYLARYSLELDANKFRDALRNAEQYLANNQGRTLPDRVKRNHEIVVAGFIQLHNKLLALKLEDIAPSPQEFATELVKMSVRLSTGTEGRTRMMVDNFIEDAINAWDMAARSGYSDPFFARMDNVEGRPVFWIHMATAYGWYRKQMRGDPSLLDKTALIHQLQETMYFIEAKRIHVKGSTRYMYGMDIEEAVKILDITSKLSRFKPRPVTRSKTK